MFLRFVVVCMFMFTLQEAWQRSHLPIRSPSLRSRPGWLWSCTWANNCSVWLKLIINIRFKNIFKQNDDSENVKNSRKSFSEMKRDEMTRGEYFSSTLFQHSQRIGYVYGIQTSSYFLIQFKLRTAHTFEERLLCEK